MKDYSKILKKYYREKDIGVNKFNCPKFNDCGQSVYPRPIYRSTETHIGTNYGEAVRIVCLQEGGGEKPRDIDTRRKEIEYLDTLEDPELSQTMLGIKRVMTKVLDFIVPDTRRIHSYYALSNISNCSFEEGMHNINPIQMYRNCSGYLLDELFLLEPNLIITIGPIAGSALGILSELRRDVLEFAIENPDLEEEDNARMIRLGQRYFGVLSFKNGTSTYVLKVPNPTDRGAWQSFEKTSLVEVAWIANELIYPSKYSGLGSL